MTRAIQCGASPPRRSKRGPTGIYVMTRRKKLKPPATAPDPTTGPTLNWGHEPGVNSELSGLSHRVELTPLRWDARGPFDMARAATPIVSQPSHSLSVCSDFPTKLVSSATSRTQQRAVRDPQPTGLTTVDAFCLSIGHAGSCMGSSASADRSVRDGYHATSTVTPGTAIESVRVAHGAGGVAVSRVSTIIGECSSVSRRSTSLRPRTAGLTVLTPIPPGWTPSGRLGRPAGCWKREHDPVRSWAARQCGPGDGGVRRDLSALARSSTRGTVGVPGRAVCLAGGQVTAPSVRMSSRGRRIRRSVRRPIRCEPSSSSVATASG